MVPCDEYFEVSFSFVDTGGNVINFPTVGNQGVIYSITSPMDSNGVVTVKMVPENGQWGSGFVNAVGATTVSNGTSFNLNCANNAANIKVRTNYMLTATNDGGTPNYARTLDTVTDAGTWGSGLVITPPANPAASFGVGQTQCANGQFVTTFAYPASGTTGITNTQAPVGGTTATPQGTTATPQGTTAANQGTTAANQATNTNGQATTVFTPPPPVGPTIPFVPIKPASGGSALVISGLLALFCILITFF